MNQTTDPGTHDAGQTTGQTPGQPRLDRDRVHELDQLRRSRSDRYVAGVAGGLGRHFGIDPTVIRVLLVVMSIFGGAGLVLYAAAWLLVPEEGSDRAVWHLRPDTRRTLLIGAAILGVVIVVGHAWGGAMWGGGWGFGWPIGVLAILAAILLVSSQRGTHHREESTMSTTPTNPAGSSGSADSLVDETTDASGHHEPPSWTPPVADEPRPPRRPRRTGLLLFWPTLAAIALTEGLLGIWDIDHHVAAGAWVALALAIVGAALVIGAYVGRPGGLILLGLPLIPALIATSVLNGAHWQTHTVRYDPTAAVLVQDHYRIDNGRLDLDLRDVADPASLDGRTVSVSLGAGEITVEPPPGTRVVVDARIRYAGDIQAGDREQSGFGNHVQTVVDTSNGKAGAPTLTLDLDARVGHIVIQEN